MSRRETKLIGGIIHAVGKIRVARMRKDSVSAAKALSKRANLLWRVACACVLFSVRLRNAALLCPLTGAEEEDASAAFDACGGIKNVPQAEAFLISVHVRTHDAALLRQYLVSAPVLWDIQSFLTRKQTLLLLSRLKKVHIKSEQSHNRATTAELMAMLNEQRRTSGVSEAHDDGAASVVPSTHDDLLHNILKAELDKRCSRGDERGSVASVGTACRSTSYAEGDDDCAWSEDADTDAHQRCSLHGTLMLPPTSQRGLNATVGRESEVLRRTPRGSRLKAANLGGTGWGPSSTGAFSRAGSVASTNLFSASARPSIQEPTADALVDTVQRLVAKKKNPINFRIEAKDVLLQNITKHLSCDAPKARFCGPWCTTQRPDTRPFPVKLRERYRQPKTHGTTGSETEPDASRRCGGAATAKEFPKPTNANGTPARAPKVRPQQRASLGVGRPIAHRVGDRPGSPGVLASNTPARSQPAGDGVGVVASAAAVGLPYALSCSSCGFQWCMCALAGVAVSC